MISAPLTSDTPACMAEWTGNNRPDGRAPGGDDLGSAKGLMVALAMSLPVYSAAALVVHWVF